MDTNFKHKWNLWFHNIRDVWTIEGYKKIYSIETIREYWKLYNNWDKIGTINNKHFFLMREGISPIWEDEKNKNGGCWSFKITESNSQELWNDLSKYLITDSLSSVEDDIVGISACLKKNNFSVIKIWNINSSNNNINLLNKEILDKWGMDIIYIAHMPELNV